MVETGRGKGVSNDFLKAGKIRGLPLLEKGDEALGKFLVGFRFF